MVDSTRPVPWGWCRADAGRCTHPKGMRQHFRGCGWRSGADPVPSPRCGVVESTINHYIAARAPPDRAARPPRDVRDGRRGAGAPGRSAVGADRARRRRVGARRRRPDPGQLHVPGVPDVHHRGLHGVRRRERPRRVALGVARPRGRRPPGRSALDQPRPARPRRRRALRVRAGRRRRLAAAAGDARHLLLAGVADLHRLRQRLRDRAGAPRRVPRGLRSSPSRSPARCTPAIRRSSA